MKKPWITRVAAIALMVLGYVVQRSLIPSGYTWHGIHLAGAATALWTFIGGVGISGPQLWPALAKLMGNPGTSPATTPAEAPKP